MKTIVFDFDGVIHTYKSVGKEFKPWVIEGDPVPGVKEFIDKLKNNGFKVIVYSSRCSSNAGYTAVLQWLINNDIQVNGISTGTKPAGTVYLDDRAVRFDGNFTDELYDEITNFKTYWEREEGK